MTALNKLPTKCKNLLFNSHLIYKKPTNINFENTLISNVSACIINSCNKRRTTMGIASIAPTSLSSSYSPSNQTNIYNKIRNNYNNHRNKSLSVKHYCTSTPMPSKEFLAIQEQIRQLAVHEKRNVIGFTIKDLEVTNNIDIIQQEFNRADANKDQVLSSPEFKEYWLQRISTIGETVKRDAPVEIKRVEDNISFDQYSKVYFRAAMPFVVFGFVDNFIMIIAGETIDLQLGMKLGITTMCAAGFGNLFSDVIGTASGSLIQSVAERLKIQKPNLTVKQQVLPSVRFVKSFACLSGIAIGCLLGMFPLLFYSSKKETLEEEES